MKENKENIQKKANGKKRVKTFVSEFKTFAMRGNVIDLAVGVIIGAAFGKITASLVDNIIMPFIGIFTGGVNFDSWMIKIGPIFGDGEAAQISIGTFLATVLDFIIIAFVVFLLMRVINRLKKKEEEKPAPPPKPGAEEILLTEIRDLLKNR